MRKINLEGAKNVHFIGIGGISMSGLSEVLKRDGYNITGSDDVETNITRHLQSIGIDVKIPNAAANITPDMDLAVYTAAVRENNPEYQAAAQTGIPLMDRAKLLGLILMGYKFPICIAGTHGKTTTTSMMAEIATHAGLDPTISVGGHMKLDGKNYRVGESPYFVMEACEYNNSYHHWHPHVAVILNIDADHLDFFGDMGGVIDSFKKFAQNIRPEGTLVIQADTPGFKEVTEGLPCNIITFGMENARYYPANITYDSLGRPEFDIMDGGNFMGRVLLPLPGQYNMLNALACFAAAASLGISPESAVKSLCGLQGIQRRFQLKGSYNGADIIDDYAHHPTEIKACLHAAKQTGRRILCLFQPHTYTRTRNHFEDFANSFQDASLAMFLPIYAAREPFDPTISSLMLAENIEAKGKNTIHFNDFAEARDFLAKNLQPNDLLITMGAGDVFKVGESLLST
ncbi:MAG: UDP-N-acetylmuramate--L-alanine ligase [Defluviitaleaceae bacterium]|nr:UDP-N-acetylmuramate--L-alanine ligase [Defluviitaleaceae bacterium]